LKSFAKFTKSFWSSKLLPRNILKLVVGRRFGYNKNHYSKLLLMVVYYLK
jgi:hypothetical protein